MLRVRIANRFPNLPIGKHLAFHCEGDDQHIYFCKSDADGRAIRATEWIATKLAAAVGLPVAPCTIIEDFDGNETYFGSRSPGKVAQKFDLQSYFERRARNELGQLDPWLGSFLSRIWAFDLFINNPDRMLANFVLDDDELITRIRTIDFADASLVDFPIDRFPPPSSNTQMYRRMTRQKYGAHKAAALDLLDQVATVPSRVVEGFVRVMPPEWLSNARAEHFLGVWSDERLRQRISLTRDLIEDERED